jgi:eukaryotic-like serine/threonine-protein kinase
MSFGRPAGFVNRETRLWCACLERTPGQLSLIVESLTLDPKTPARQDGSGQEQMRSVRNQGPLNVAPRLMPGARLGSYQIEQLLGTGGMGEVYRARDTRLGRDVAIKIISGCHPLDDDRRARFGREARVLASLNHPNIAAIYGFEDAIVEIPPGTQADPQGQSLLIMELVDGEDLSQRLSRGPLPIQEAMEIGGQIAEALEAAHEQGIVHRDLKPSNVKIREDGTVKVLDFGLAKALSSDGAGAMADAATSPTVTGLATQPGFIIGTAAYMSPEQARGKAADRRADVWAFGVVLYEMLAGRRAFDGGEVSDVLAAVLKETPSMEALPTGTPEPVRRLIRRCLVKDRRERLADLSAARLEIRDALSGDVPAASSVASTTRRRIEPVSIAASI